MGPRVRSARGDDGTRARRQGEWPHDGRVTLPSFPRLESLPVLDHLDLVAAPVAAALASWPAADRAAVVEIDPDLADTAAMTAEYDLPLAASGNCVVVTGRRAGEERTAACVVRADTRADVNTLVRRLLDVRKATFLSMDRAVEESGMEYGGITPVGLPDGLAAAGRRAAAGRAGGDPGLRRTTLQAAAARQHPGRPARAPRSCPTWGRERGARADHPARAPRRRAHGLHPALVGAGVPALGGPAGAGAAVPARRDPPRHPRRGRRTSG